MIFLFALLLGVVPLITASVIHLETEPPIKFPYNTLSLNTSANITHVVINNPPINLCDYKLITDLYTLLTTINTTSNPPKVVIFSSANPSFFIDHADIHQFDIKYPIDPVLNINTTAIYLKYVAVTRLLASLPQIFIAQISGRAFGTGNEIAVQMDMRFASPGARLGTLEVALGDFPGVGGAQYMARQLGPGRAAEYILAQLSVEGKALEHTGWVNSFFESAAEMETHVDKLAARIVLWPRGGLVATKRAIRDGAGPSLEVLNKDLTRFVQLAYSLEAQSLGDKFLELNQNQSLSEFELGLTEDLVKLVE